MRYKVDRRIVLQRDFDTGIGIIIPAEKRGEIIDRDPETGTLEVRLDEPEPGLEHWHNLITVTTDDYDYIRPEQSTAFLFFSHRNLRLVATTVALLSFFAIGEWDNLHRHNAGLDMKSVTHAANMLSPLQMASASAQCPKTEKFAAP